MGLSLSPLPPGSGTHVCAPGSAAHVDGLSIRPVSPACLFRTFSASLTLSLPACPRLLMCLKPMELPLYSKTASLCHLSSVLESLCHSVQRQLGCQDQGHT